MDNSPEIFESKYLKQGFDDLGQVSYFLIGGVGLLISLMIVPYTLAYLSDGEGEWYESDVEVYFYGLSIMGFKDVLILILLACAFSIILGFGVTESQRRKRFVLYLAFDDDKHLLTVKTRNVFDLKPRKHKIQYDELHLEYRSGQYDGLKKGTYDAVIMSQYFTNIGTLYKSHFIWEGVDEKRIYELLEKVAN